MSTSLTVNTTSGAPADGTTTNTATATLMNGDTYISDAQLEFSIVAGNAIFTNGTNKIIARTSSLGESSVTFTDTVEENVTILVILTSDATVYETASSSFSADGGNAFELALTTTSTAVANGIDYNTATAMLLKKGVPTSGENIIFTITTGHAVFAGNSKTTTVTTGIQGMVSVKFTDQKVEMVTIIATVEKDNSVYQTACSTFAPSQALSVVRVYNDNNIEFTNGAPHTWIPSAKLYVEVNDKSDSVTWATSNPEFKIYGSNGVGTITFPGILNSPPEEMVVVIAENLTEYVTYELTCDFSIRMVRGAEIGIDGYSCATQNQLLHIYNEWGDMSTYNWQLDSDNLKYSEEDRRSTTKIVDMKNGLVITESVKDVKVAERN